ncbi:MAG: sulfite exporter TauE/SafE family protein [Candidatus Omnitrophota bacterium]|nr:MAG: sulfite exporter TauE/SafE family protein [Candidatus Omnitrophota bacterium]
MILELSLTFIIGITMFAFLCEYMDSTLGMGYGTTLTPVLLIMGFEPLQVVPVVLLSELISGLLAGIFHQREGNVNFRPKSLRPSVIWGKLNTLGWVASFKRGFPLHLKIAGLLALCSIIGTVTAVFIALNISKFWVKLYIGFLVLSMGIMMLIFFNKKFSFSKRKIFGLGMLASFNKGISGGGYGPLVTSGQILSGVEGKSAVGITSLAEGLTCAVGILTYIFVSKNPLDLKLAPFIIIGAVLSVPFSAKSVRKLTEKRLKFAIATLTIILGIFTIVKTLKS